MTTECPVCGGTILPHATSGAERGSCHCPRGPGRIKARMYYGTESRPGGYREYDVEWFGDVIPIEPPTLQAAVDHLNALRSALGANINQH